VTLGCSKETLGVYLLDNVHNDSTKSVVGTASIGDMHFAVIDNSYGDPSVVISNGMQVTVVTARSTERF
jgi:hypothetical protein